MSLLREAKRKIALWREDPRRFAVEELKVKELDEFQEDFCLALASSKPIDQRIALKGSKGTGKSFCLTLAGWWFMGCQGDQGDHPNGIALSISGNNLRDNLWKELAKWRQRSEYLSRAFTQTATRIFAVDHPETWWLAARNWSKSASTQEQSDTLAGLHSGYTIVLMDEGAAIPTAVAATAEAALSSVVWGKFIQSGNTTSLEGPLYDACNRQRKFWRVIQVNGDPDNPKRAKRVNIEWARQQIEMYGREHPWVLVNVFGEFPPSSINTLLSPDEVEKAFTRFGAIKEEDYNYAQKRIGCDVQRFGGARNVFYPRQGLISLKPVVERGARGPVLAARLALMLQRWGGKVTVFIDDTGGYGATLEDSLHTMHIPYIPVNFSDSATDNRFANKRAENYWEMAEWVKRGGALHPEIQEVLPELTQVHYTYTSKGKFLMEPKEIVAATLGYSPDLTDALSLTFSHPEAPDLHSETGQALAMAGAGIGGLKSEWDPLGVGR